MDSLSFKSDSYRLVSPTQIFIAAILGGPVAGCVFLGLNFKAMGETQFARQTLRWGVIGIVILFAVLFVLPKEIPGSVPAVAVSFTFRALAKQFQEKAYLAHIAAGGLKFSWWSIIGISLLCLLGSLLIIGVFGYSLSLVFPNLLN